MPKPSKSRLSVVILLLVGMILPVCGALQLGAVRWALVPLAVYLIVSVVAFVQVRADKARAERAERRIPEKQLHLLELFGGWPGAWLAQRIHRHKTRKVSFQIVFWLIVLVHQAGWGAWLLRDRL